MEASFRWNEWNVEHIGHHGVTPDEAERVVRLARRPWPRKIGGEKWLVWGRGDGGRLLQVVFVHDADGTTFVLHARPLVDSEKRRYRRYCR